jgi:hypothetical protein
MWDLVSPLLCFCGDAILPGTFCALRPSEDETEHDEISLWEKYSRAQTGQYFATLYLMPTGVRNINALVDFIIVDPLTTLSHMGVHPTIVCIPLGSLPCTTRGRWKVCTSLLVTEDTLTRIVAYCFSSARPVSGRVPVLPEALGRVLSYLDSASLWDGQLSS